MTQAAKFLKKSLVLLFVGMLVLELIAYFYHSPEDCFFMGAALALFLVTSIRPLYGIGLFVALLPVFNGIFLLTGHGDTSQLFSFIFLPWAAHLFFKKSRSSLEAISVYLVNLLVLIILLNFILALSRMTHWPPLSRYWLEWLSTFHFSHQTDPHWQLKAAFIFLKGLFFFQILCEEIRNRKQWLWISRLIYIQAGGILFFSFYQLLNYTLNDRDFLGLSLPFNDIHSFGSAVVLMFFIFLVNFSRSEKLHEGVDTNPSWSASTKFGRVANGILLIGFFTLCVLTSSRVTWLVAVFLLFVFFAVQKQRKSLFVIAIFVLVGLVAGNILERNLIHSENPAMVRLGSLFDIENVQKDEALNVRYELWKRSLKMVGEYPLTGVGIGNYYRNSKFFQFLSVGRWDSENAHNYYLQVAAELGFPGILLFCGILLSLFWERRPTENVIEGLPSNELFSLIPFRFGLLAYMLTMLTGHPLLLSNQQFLFWYIAALIVSGLQVMRSRQDVAVWKNRLLAYISTVAFIVYVVGYLNNIVKNEPWTIPRTYGFYSEEQWKGTTMRWMAGKAMYSAKIKGKRLFFRVVALPFNSKKPEGLKVNIGINGRSAENLHFLEGGSRIISLPVLPQDDGEVQISFEVDKVFSPQQIGLNNDSRLLGVAIGELDALPVQPGVQMLLSNE